MRPQNVLSYENRQERGFKGPTLWRVKSQELAAAPLSRRELTPAEWARKNDEYLQLVQRIRQRQALDKVFLDKQRGIAYLTQENDKVRAVLTDIITALAAWVVAHSSDDDFMTTSAGVGLLRMLDERQDLVAALRFGQSLPKDSTVSSIDRPVLVDVVEFAISVIPIAGTAVAIFEAVSGRDLFGYELDPLERSILAAGALLPIASRLVREGRVLYTAARLERLYGSQASRWSTTLAAGERLSSDPGAMQAISQADTLVKAHTKIDAQLATKVADSFERLGLKGARAPSLSPLPLTVSAALKRLVSIKPFLAELDELALQRVIDKGPSVNRMKGQLLEELLQSRIAGWLRDLSGVAALGIAHPPAGLEFIPGHLIRDAAGRQITDGMLVRRGGDVLEIVTIFEAKAGTAKNARELSFASGSISGLTIDERLELRAVARDDFRSLRARARRTGASFPTTAAEIQTMIDQLERQIILTEKGGQVLRDIERLSENENGALARLIIGTEETQVRISPTQTKIFGVLPKNIKPGNMERDLQQARYKFEVLGMNVTDKELVELTQILRPFIVNP